MRSNRRGTSVEASAHRVIRGGSWNNDAQNVPRRTATTTSPRTGTWLSTAGVLERFTFASLRSSPERRIHGLQVIGVLPSRKAATVVAWVRQPQDVPKHPGRPLSSPDRGDRSWC